MGIYEAALIIKADEVREETTQEIKASFVTNLLRDTNCSIEKIARLADASVDFVKSIKSGLAII